jgi:cell wall-associated NlpC family hydrolase
VRVRALGAVICSSLIVPVAAAPSVANAYEASATEGAQGAPIETSAAGGVAPTAPSTSTKSTPGTSTSTSSSSSSSTSASSTPKHHAPVTARTSNIAYDGPVYERTEGGQIVPYASTAATARTDKAAESSSGGSVTGTTSESTKPELLVPGHTAHIIDGLAAAPMDAPASVKAMIWAGNEIVGLPYIYGGGHASFISPGYDCSGTVSYALHGADLLESPMDSTEFESWGESGIGTWVTIFANGGHAYMTVAGVRLDTSAAEDPSGLQGPRWRPLRQTNEGFVVRHPRDL